jgi:outer membrane protein OmpA-like peptidoglycan-associated protein
MSPPVLALLCAAGLMLGGCQSGNSSSDEANQLRQENEALRQRLTQQGQPVAPPQTRPVAQPRANPVQPVVYKPSPAPAQPKPEPKADASVAGLPATYDKVKKELTVTIPGDVLFDSGSAELKPGAKATLDRVVAAMKKDYANRPIRVEGHTDTDPIDKTRGQWLDNLELSQFRAGVVARYLVEKGISPKSITRLGHGEKFPKSTKPASRRVEIVVVLG